MEHTHSSLNKSLTHKWIIVGDFGNLSTYGATSVLARAMASPVVAIASIKPPSFQSDIFNDKKKRGANYLDFE